MTAVPLRVYKLSAVSDITDEECLKLLRLIKMSSDNNGILILKSLRSSIKKAIEGRRKRPQFKKVQYQWINPKELI